MSSTVIGIQGASVVFTAMKELEEKETDWPNRRPRTAYWSNMKEVVDVLGGRPNYSKPEADLTGLKAKDVKRGME